ncbi:hypothetical protein EDI_325380 [Entamoeba dispar SAW760]|uniref:Uncharacterized protein n=1 Tax=Entamoeba dispar (strain ATCC PRA-260 / SAW760) TaxID=370354 RepID=B0EBP9_ENTDS|nr:uncharacterized protein EDI_325380 [Entamoeba dispar SAW760]EDR28061.1 hypothetical protein EDI_325380 [Entamoeba dispar SAW760]|eukprot:EDR28061.1 hypothetical protein EDI_325380 [Entamoeba dispar SAW760]
MLYYSKTSLIYDRDEFKIFKTLNDISIALSVFMLVGGIASTGMIHFKKRIITIINICVQIFVVIMAITAIGYSSYTLIKTQQTILNYWNITTLTDTEDIPISQLIEASFRCCGYDSISPSNCACKNPMCFDVLCKTKFEELVQTCNMTIFITHVICGIVVTATLISSIYSLVKKDRPKYIQFQ